MQRDTVALLYRFARGCSVSVASAFAFTAASLKTSGMDSPAAQRRARSAKCGLSGDADCPGAFIAVDWSQSCGVKATANGFVSGCGGAIGPTLNRRRAES